MRIHPNNLIKMFYKSVHGPYYYSIDENRGESFISTKNEPDEHDILFRILSDGTFMYRDKELGKVTIYHHKFVFMLVPSDVDTDVIYGTREVWKPKAQEDFIMQIAKIYLDKLSLI